MDVDVYDPWASAEEVKHEYNIDIMTGDNMPEITVYSKRFIMAVAHKSSAYCNLLHLQIE